MKARRLILEQAKILERDILEDFFNHEITREKPSQEEEIETEEIDKNISNAEHVDFSNIKTSTGETQIRYRKLGKISEKISPYRIYEIPDDWDEEKDGSPLVVLEELMPIFRMRSEEEIEEQDSDDESVSQSLKAEIQSEHKETERKFDVESDTEPESESVEKEKQCEEIFSKSENSESDKEVFQADPQVVEAKSKADSINVSQEVDTEIENDIEGLEIQGNSSMNKYQNIKRMNRMPTNENIYCGSKRKQLKKREEKSDSSQENSDTLYINDYHDRRNIKRKGWKDNSDHN